VKRPAYGLLVGVAVTMGVVAVVVSQLLDRRLLDPDGFLGPAWVRLPAMVLGAFLLDVVPRSVWRSRWSFRTVVAEARTLVRDHWTPQRLALLTIGLTCFYVTYVSYRNLKNYLPDLYDATQDSLLHRLDRAVFFGHEPATILHAVFGETWAAHFFAFIYLLYLPLAPLSLVVWLVWSKRIEHGYWYATANCLTWALGTISYYAIPSLGPAFNYPWLYEGLDVTGVSTLQDSLWDQRQDHRFPLSPFSESIQSVAGFASLHVALTLVIALVAHYTVRAALVRWAAWTFCGLTTVSTLYFGWHYIADDIGGAVIAWASVWLGAWATGQKLDWSGGSRGGGVSRAQAGGDASSRVEENELQRIG
jgi:hypothetical protein